nr:NAD(P)/FAD-dependent oxidoreductase [Tomitella biformata]
MIGPDFPFPYDDYRLSPAGLGSVPASAFGTEVAVVGGGLAGIITAYELMRMGLRPVVYEPEQIGGRMRSAEFEGFPGTVAELGAMRFPLSSTTLHSYLAAMGLPTRPFANPLATDTPSTVIDLKGNPLYARNLDDLPPEFRLVAQAWGQALEDGANLGALTSALRARDPLRIKAIWNDLVRRLDDHTFYHFLADSPHFRSFADRELFGQVGFGTGGWDTDFPNSILEVLRIVATGADEDQHLVIGGCQQLPLRLWSHQPDALAGWPAGTSLQALHAGSPRPGVTALRRTHSGITVTDAAGAIRTYPAVVYAAPIWLLLNNIECDESLFSSALWTSIERTHYMGSSKVFVLVDRPFWRDQDPATGRDTMSITLTDRMSRGTYLFDDGPDRPAVICLSYTWADDSLKLLPLSATERMDLMLHSLGEIYPGVDIRSHIIASPITVSWEMERNFMGAFKANLPGHYRYQEQLFGHFMQDQMPDAHRGIFLAGDDISWTAAWAEGAVQSALNAVWGVQHHFGGVCDPDNLGPGDRFAEFAPIRLPDIL